jgi:hypothetical protein
LYAKGGIIELMAKCVGGAITASTRADAKDERSMLKPNI